MTERKLVGQYAGFLSRAVGLILDYVIIAAIIVGSGIVVNLLFSALRIDLAACPAGTPIDSVTTAGVRGRSRVLGILRNHSQPALLCVLLEPDRADHRAARDGAASRAAKWPALGLLVEPGPVDRLPTVHFHARDRVPVGAGRQPAHGLARQAGANVRPLRVAGGAERALCRQGESALRPAQSDFSIG